MIRKADIILAILLIVSGLIVSYVFVSDNDTGDYVSVSIDGELHSSYPLSEDRTIEIAENNALNKITIKGGVVSMTFSDCPNQDCVKHRPISNNAESIVCLPHKLVVEISSGKTGFDAIAQ